MNDGFSKKVGCSFIDVIKAYALELIAKFRIVFFIPIFCASIIIGALGSVAIIVKSPYKHKIRKNAVCSRSKVNWINLIAILAFRISPIFALNVKMEGLVVKSVNMVQRDCLWIVEVLFVFLPLLWAWIAVTYIGDFFSVVFALFISPRHHFFYRLFYDRVCGRNLGSVRDFAFYLGVDQKHADVAKVFFCKPYHHKVELILAKDGIAGPSFLHFWMHKLYALKGKLRLRIKILASQFWQIAPRRNNWNITSRRGVGTRRKKQRYHDSGNATVPCKFVSLFHGKDYNTESRIPPVFLLGRASVPIFSAALFLAWQVPAPRWRLQLRRRFWGRPFLARRRWLPPPF